MSTLVIQSAGLLTTVQDLGRPGYGAAGISPSGAADSAALRLGNLLVGNDPGAAALEMTLTGGTFTFRDNRTISLTGSDFGPHLNGHRLEMWRSYQVVPGDTLTLGATRGGARSYLCVAGGVSTAPFLGSASTHLMSGLGGFEGRALCSGDVVPLGAWRGHFSERRISNKVVGLLRPRDWLRVTDGPQAEQFDESERKGFMEGAFRVGEESDRLGLRLEGPRIRSKRSEEMTTEGVSLGAIQVTPSGQAIILFVEQQTTGGYPKIANIIAADLFRIGQLRPRDTIRFERVSFVQARAALAAQERLLSAEDLFA